ncbi:hypothetical protein FA09DRAFT_362346 [Tilletiopsis washingtonensis]|jgi:hydroxyacyl-ACP dehydratase HTD2-like protein with hotdog domain|uniref:Thioesterase/thiol ester dehydrase-isomerase n=1 Tax=Tilletiopsis washingtonensis TaxID=58919 RepID=A0A316Z730_9BASI|nr:hypothetical protein FA09DRAFT_362346 [Tilletiopsis washingtonensis]PWN96035.1 hypothetical protein FA09DRAFT_362346 [Tilletiopsis washingtonensis]
MQALKFATRPLTRSLVLKPSPSAARCFSAGLASMRSAHFPEWASEEAVASAQGLLARFPLEGEPAASQTQRLDATHLFQQRLLLSDMVPPHAPLVDPAEGTPLLPGEHLCFFLPRARSADLGADGSDRTFNPPAPFVRRMWAGGSMTWSRENPLLVGEKAYEHTWVEDVQVKRTAKGDEMLVVWVRKELGNERGPSIEDRRSWLFQRPLQDGGGALPRPVQSQHGEPAQSDKLGLAAGATAVQQTPATLFRYSALTYNAHAIHLDAQWAREREGHPTTVVHGPMTLALLLRKWGAEHAGWRIEHDGRLRGDAGKLARVEYRAKRPLWTGERYWLGKVEASSGSTDTMLAVKEDGTVVMEAIISPA